MVIDVNFKILEHIAPFALKGDILVGEWDAGIDSPMFTHCHIVATAQPAGQIGNFDRVVQDDTIARIDFPEQLEASVCDLLNKLAVGKVYSPRFFALMENKPQTLREQIQGILVNP